MRKTITTLLIIFLTLGLFAETGYAGNEWGMPKSWLRFDDEIEDYGIKNKIMLGDETRVFYCFCKNKLEGISYSIPENKTNQLLEKYSKNRKIGIIKIEQLTKKDVYKELDPEYQNTTYFEVYLHNFCYNAALQCDVYFNMNYQGEGTCSVHVFNYNDDTRVYIFENLVEGKTFVYYTFREQDY